MTINIEVNNTGTNKCEVRIGNSSWLFSYQTLAAGSIGRGASRREYGIDSSRTTNKHIYEFLGCKRPGFETVSEEELMQHFEAALRGIFLERLVQPLTDLRDLSAGDNAPARVVNRIEELLKHVKGEDR